MSIWIYVVWFNNQPPKYKLWTRFWFELLWGRNISIIRPDRCSTDASRGLNLRMLGTTLNTSLPSKPILGLHSAQPLWLHWCSNLSLIPRIFGNWNRTKILKCPDTYSSAIKRDLQMIFFLPGYKQYKWKKLVNDDS